MIMGARVVLGEGWAELRDELGVVQDRISRAAGIDQDGRTVLVNAGGALSNTILDSLRPLSEQMGAFHGGIAQIASNYSISPEVQAGINRLISGYQSPELKEAIRIAFPPRPSFPAPALIKSRPEPQGLIAPSVAELDAIQAGKPISARRGRNENSWSYLPFIPRIESLLAKGLPHKAIVDRKNWAGNVNEAESRQVVYATSLDAAVDGLARFIKRKYFPSA
jgi:hypothetical protein